MGKSLQPPFVRTAIFVAASGRGLAAPGRVRGALYVAIGTVWVGLNAPDIGVGQSGPHVHARGHAVQLAFGVAYIAVGVFEFLKGKRANA